MYKRGKDNAATNIMSQLSAVETEIKSAQLQELTSSLKSDWEDHMLEGNNSDPWIHNIIARINLGDFDLDYVVNGGILY